MELVPLARGKKGGRKKGKKNRKWGRYEKHPSSVRYRAERRWIRNRQRRIQRHLRRYPKDAQAQRALAVEQ